MKFRDGYWELKKGVTLFHPIEVRDVEVGAGALTFYSSCRQIRRRGDTLGGPMLTTTFSSPFPDVVHVRTVHFKGVPDPGPRFDISPDDPSVGTVDRNDLEVTYRSGGVAARVAAGTDYRVDFTFEGRLLTGVDGRHSGYVAVENAGAILGETAGVPQTVRGHESGARFMSEHLTLSVGEHIYGLGERFTPFVRNGQIVDIWNEDGGTSSELSYKNVPFYISDRGYGVLVSNPGYVSFEIGSEVVTSVQFSVPGEVLDYYIIGGADMKDVLRNYSKLAGRPALPPKWSFGLWLSTSFTTDYDEATVTHFIDGMAERRIPLHVFHFDCFWMKEFQWVDLQWDREQFPDPPAMLRRLKDRGLHICLWINPYIAQKSRLFDEGMSGGYLVKRRDGSIWQWDRWQAGMALVDFTNPDAVAWFKNGLKELLDAGVDTFKTDFGERIPTDVVYHSGADPHRMHNFYSYLYNRTVFDLLVETRGAGEAVVFARSATVGGQKFPVHWGGDCSATFESMAESLRGGLSLSLSGFGFWSHDIGGFEHTATADLFKRWIAFGALSSHSRLHGNESYRVPWNFDEESGDVLRHFAQLKCRLMPYLFGQACIAHVEGLPVLRPMVLEFPEDPGCTYLDRQYMLGDSLLVAPVFSEDGKVSYYVPDGAWTVYSTGERFRGGAWRTESHQYLSLPLLVREGSVVAIGAEENRPDYDFADGIAFHVFELPSGATARATVHSADGEPELEVAVSRSERGNGRNDAIRARVAQRKTLARKEELKPWSVCLRGIAAVTEVTGAVAQPDPLGVILQALPGSSEVSARLPGT